MQKAQPKVKLFADDTILIILWTKVFVEAQGCKVKANIVNSDNTSATKLEMNGKTSLCKRTRHLTLNISALQIKLREENCK